MCASEKCVPPGWPSAPSGEHAQAIQRAEAAFGRAEALRLNAATGGDFLHQSSTRLRLGFDFVNMYSTAMHSIGGLVLRWPSLSGMVQRHVPDLRLEQ